MWNFFLIIDNSPCTLDDGQKGTCLDIRSCPLVYNLFIQERRITKLCGYNGPFPVVCCPNQQENQNVHENEETQERIPGELSRTSKFKDKYVYYNFFF